MEPEKIATFTLKSYQQRPELVDPGEGTFNCEPSFVHVAVEMPLSTTFRRFSTALVFINVRNNASVPEHLACSAGIKTTVRIEECTRIRQSSPFQVSKQLFERLCQLIRIIVIASKNIGRRKNIAIAINQRQDVTGFGFLPALIGYAFAPFLATLWLPSRCNSDKCSSPRTEIRLASKRRWRLPSVLHLRK